MIEGDYGNRSGIDSRDSYIESEEFEELVDSRNYIRSKATPIGIVRFRAMNCSEVIRGINRFYTKQEILMDFF